MGLQRSQFSTLLRTKKVGFSGHISIGTLHLHFSITWQLGSTNWRLLTLITGDDTPFFCTSLYFVSGGAGCSRAACASQRQRDSRDAAEQRSCRDCCSGIAADCEPLFVGDHSG